MTETPILRLLFTGSRTWDHWPSIARELEDFARLAASQGMDGLSVVHGAADSGADFLAASWVTMHQRRGWPVVQERFPAPWGEPCRDRCEPGHRRVNRRGEEYCPATGNYRNETMLASGPFHRGVAFRRNHSRGTGHCIRIARAAKIEMRVVYWADRNLGALS